MTEEAQHERLKCWLLPKTTVVEDGTGLYVSWIWVFCDGSRVCFGSRTQPW